MTEDDDLRRLRNEYLADVRETVELIRQHGHGLATRGSFKQSFPVLLFLAHQLKGSGGSLGFPRITELALQMSRELNLFLDDEQTPRPTPQQLSEALLTVAQELENEVEGQQTAAG